MQPIELIQSRTVVLASTNIDTDQIIPARFLTTTSREGLGAHLFADWRYDSAGQPRADFVLNTPAAAGCEILVAGRNIGCGSSREHAPWALMDFGFKTIISTQIADIFRGNSLKNGLLPIVVDESTHEYLLAHPGIALKISIVDRTLTLPDGRNISFALENFARFCLLNGTDELGYLLSQSAQIEHFEKAHQS